MTKRARLTLQEVLLHCDSDDYFDDPDEPVMDGSDNEFSDLEGNNLDKLEGDLDSGPNPSPNAGSPESSSASASPSSPSFPDSSGLGLLRLPWLHNLDIYHDMYSNSAIHFSNWSD